jgi:hypothetical protein
MELTEEQISKLAEKSREIIQPEEHREKNDWIKRL